MKRLLTALAAVTSGIALALMLPAGPAFAQSSGNAAGQIYSTTCSVENDGSLSTNSPAGTVECPGATSGTDCTLLMTTTITTPNGSGTALEISPSLDVGLYTSTGISGGTSGKKQQSTADAEVAVYVTVDGNLVSPGPVVYDQRYQSLSGILGQVITSTCLSNNNCVDENINLLLTTLSAHTFNLLYPVNGGNHVVNVYDQVTNQYCTNGTLGTGCSSGTTSNTASANACVGPGTLTVTQVKEFSQN